MSYRLTIRLTDELLAWLKETSRRAGIPMSKLVREQLELAKAKTGKQRFLRHAGAITGGPADVSSRNGFEWTHELVASGLANWNRGKPSHSTKRLKLKTRKTAASVILAGRR